MTTGAREHEATRRERIFVDGHQDGIAGRGLSYLILLNGVAAIVIVGAFVYGFQTSAEPKLAAAMLVFGIGAGPASSARSSPISTASSGRKCPKGRSSRARSASWPLPP